jgi:hypothetical protein
MNAAVIVALVIVVVIMLVSTRRVETRISAVATRQVPPVAVPLSSGREFCPYRVLVGTWRSEEADRECKIKTNPRDSDQLVIDSYQAGVMTSSEVMSEFRCEESVAPGDVVISALVGGVDKWYSVESREGGVYLSDGSGVVFAAV